VHNKIQVKFALNSEQVRNFVFSALGNNTDRGCVENLKFWHGLSKNNWGHTFVTAYISRGISFMSYGLL